MGNREIILQAAMELFNQVGTARTTTNHIAKHAGISPGNLYYHFSDKEHIIRAIYEQMILDWDKEYDRLENSSLSRLDVLREFIQRNFELLWKYRFFNRETIALINIDPILRQRHLEITKQRFSWQTAFLSNIAGLDDETIRSAADILTVAWITANHYLNYLESTGQTVDRTDFIKGVDLVMLIVAPLLSAGGQRA